ncbi:ATP-binding cassette domain-containing protein [Melaminivora sp.]|uniref:ABC-F family ATP-binding cassette domain-containing protein n=1 Tax=Melaminivora sp. TaxID=1933032 RepID=UPI0028AF12CD|nr:ATP-binding cassette domain-containing protein [Melaminivora sp.]
MISLKNVTLRRGAKVLLDGVSATIQPGEHVGLVGRNGAGKSSLFALLRGSLHEDAGDFSLPAQWRVAEVAQEMPETGESATDFVLQGDSRLEQLRQALGQAEQRGDGMAIAQAHADLGDAGAHDAEARAQSLILGLGFQVAQLQQPVNGFSGGWRMRLQLARALMSPSDLLLLDEPTNHLDLDALVWLEAWLKRYAGTLIVISHDREFLDAVTGVTLHIEHAQLTRYGGNYSRFEELRAQQLVLQQSAYERQQDKIAHLQRFIDRFKAKATKARQAQSRVKQIERMEKIAPVLASADFQFIFREPANLPNPMLAITDAAFGYRDDAGGEKVILRGVNRSVLAGQRIGILGANGQGKSTLVKTIAREMAPLAGAVTEGKGLTIGYFAQQELDVLRPGDDPLQHMVRLARELGLEAASEAREQELRNHLGSFNFTGDMVRQPVGSMSGGEKARLVLAMIVWQRPNLLLLDEPTNHLDLVTREALALALGDFDGTVMLVSHDRALLRAVCEDFWLVGAGTVAPFNGDLDTYQRYLLEESRRLREAAREQQDASAPLQAAARAPAASGREQRKASAQARQQLAQRTRPLRQELARIDARLAALTGERTDLEERLSAPLPPAEIAECGRRLKACNDEIDTLEERWLELSEAIEALEAEALAE